jgi:hypothetical protein
MTRCRSSPFVSIVIVAALSAACRPSEPREAGGSERRAASPFEPQRVDIRDYWMGLEPEGPIDFNWRLERQGATHTFAGTGTLTRAHGKTSGPLPVTVPDTAMTAFLRGLASAPRTPGEYTPRIQHTDDYPELTIRLHTATSLTEFFSASQGEGRVPWRVHVDARRYVSDSPAPAEALKHVLPYLRRAELERRLAESDSASRDWPHEPSQGAEVP